MGGRDGYAGNVIPIQWEMSTQKERSIQEYRARRKLKAKLLAECPEDEAGNKLCPRCKRRPDFRGLQLVHKEHLGMGGRKGLTTRVNCLILCARCHFKDEHHINEVKPKSEGGLTNHPNSV